MKIHAACLGLLSSLTFTCLTAAGAPGADVQTYLIAKGQDYRQTNATEVLSVTNESPFRFITTVEGADTNSVSSVTLALPKKSVRVLTNMEGSFAFEQDFSDKKVLDKSYGKGNYTFTIVSLNDGTNKPILTLPKADLYPVTPNIINWQDLQAVEVDQPLNIFWGVFTNGSTNDFVMLDISTANGSRVATTPALTEINQLNGTNLVGQLPADTLDYSNTYEGRLLFLKKTGENTNSYPGATGVSGYFRQTKFPIVTLPPPPDHGRIQFSARNYSVAENAGTAAITVTRSGHEGDVSVQLFTSGGTATDGLDYTGISTTLHFHDGETSMTIPLTILDDYLLEGNETVNLWLANPTGGSEIGTRTNCVLTILDNETSAAGTLQFNPAVYSLSESNASASLTITRAGGTVGTVSADFTTQDDSALAGADYVATNGTVIFTSGQTSKVISVPLINDTLHETNKTFSVKLVSTTGGAALGTGTTGTVTILDDDSGGAISFASAGISANENGTNFVVNVVRTGGKASGVTVEYFTAGGTATADVDYVSTNGILTFAANETNKTILVPIINDTLAEGSESFTLNLANATGGATLGAIPSTTLTIIDDESSVSLASANYIISEASTNIAFTVTRSGALLTAVSVDFATLGGTAVSTKDYRGTNGTLNFPANTGSQTIVIPIVNNTVVDNSRTFNFRLSNPQGGVQLGTITNSQVTITNDDFGGVIQFASATFSGVEGSNAVITLTRTGGTASGVFIYVSLAGLTATAGVDYTNISGYVAFNAGETTKTLLVPLVRDTLNENTETVALFFGPVLGGASIGAQNTATLNILNKPDPNAVPLNGPLFISGTVGTVKFSSLTSSCIASSSSNTVLQITASWTTGSGLSTVINQSTVDVSSRQLGTLNLDNSGTHGLATYVQSPLSGAGRTWAVADGSLATGSSGTFTLDAIDYTQKLASGRYTLHMQEITGNISGGFIDINASFRVALVP